MIVEKVVKIMKNLKICKLWHQSGFFTFFQSGYISVVTTLPNVKNVSSENNYHTEQQEERKKLWAKCNKSLERTAERTVSPWGTMLAYRNWGWKLDLVLFFLPFWNIFSHKKKLFRTWLLFPFILQCKIPFPLKCIGKSYWTKYDC